MAERSKAPDSRDLRLRILVHECVRGFESHFCQEILHSREKSNFLLQANALDKVVIHAFFSTRKPGGKLCHGWFIQQNSDNSSNDSYGIFGAFHFSLSFFKIRFSKAYLKLLLLF